MARISSIALLVGAALAATPAAAQDQAGCIVREQAEQLISTLKERNEQLRDMSTRMREMEARVAAADAATRELENSRKALAIAGDRNRELVEIGEAIITDYEKMDLGKKLASREPLTQLYRVRLENKLQEYRDQVAQQGFYPQKELDALQAPPTPPAAPAEPAEPAPAN